MKIAFFNSRKLWIKSFSYATAIFAIISSFATIAGISLSDIINKTNWHCRLFSLTIIYIVFTITISIIIFIYYEIRKKEVSIKINNNTIIIKQGDIFTAKGKKLIPCNEYFDTTVDDIIIAKNSLHGIFINNYVKDDIERLKDSIANTPDISSFKKYMKNNRWTYPIGRIITYDDYLLLSFTNFNEQNEAHLYKSSYAICLINMWKEISRTYALNPVFLPLLGSGITRFIDWPDRSNIDLLKCMLYTLHISGVDINKPITILLTKDVIDKINLYELKGVKL